MPSSSRSADPRKPEIRSRWRHRRLRGVWFVFRVGTRWITLRSSLMLNDLRVSVDAWPSYLGQEWEPA